MKINGSYNQNMIFLNQSLFKHFCLNENQIIQRINGKLGVLSLTLLWLILIIWIFNRKLNVHIRWEAFELILVKAIWMRKSKLSSIRSINIFDMSSNFSFIVILYSRISTFGLCTHTIRIKFFLFINLY